MLWRRRSGTLLVAAALAALFATALCVRASFAQSGLTSSADKTPKRGSAVPRTRNMPPAIEKALQYLLRTQNADGGWGAEKGFPSTGADTAIAALALLRAGVEPTQRDDESRALAAALAALVREVDASDGRTAALPHDSVQVQLKLGGGADCCLVTMALAEGVGTVSKTDRPRFRAALTKCVRKVGNSISRPLEPPAAGGDWRSAVAKSDNIFPNDPKRSVLRLQALQRAAVAGVFVDEVAEAAVEAIIDGVHGGGGLDSDACTIGILHNARLLEAWRRSHGRTPSQHAGKRDAQIDEKCDGVLRHVIQEMQIFPGSYLRIHDAEGEYPFFYMLLSEAFAARGGSMFDDWQRGVSKQVWSRQDAAGSFTGLHCISGTTFPTAAMVLAALAAEAPQAPGDDTARRPRSLATPPVTE